MPHEPSHSSTRAAPAEAQTVQLMPSQESPDIFHLVMNFLQTPGHVLLIQGSPGSGKTTFALEILNRLEGRHKIYASSRVAPARLRMHFPWIDEVIDSMSGRRARASWIDELHDLRRVEPDTVFNQVLRLKHSKEKALLVVDSWEGAIRTTNDEGRKMLETAVLSELDESNVSVVLVAEEPKNAGTLGYLVDGIVTLDETELDGRRLRTIALNKLRGFKVSTKRGLFSLDGARFSLLPIGQRAEPSGSSKRLIPVSHPPHAFSLGSKDLDRVLGGHVSSGSFMLIDFESNVSPVDINGILNVMRANFINQNGPCFILPTGAYSSSTVAESLSRYTGWEAIEHRVRIMEYNQNLPTKKWRVNLKGKLLEDVKAVYSAWQELRTITPHRMLNADVDKISEIYGEDLSDPVFSELGPSLRDDGALEIAIASRDTKVRDEFLRTSDYHLKVRNADGSLVLYGVKPFTPIYGVDLNYDRGYPQLNLTQVV